MRSLLLLSAFLMCGHQLLSQQEPDVKELRIISEIDSTVWRPFKHTFEARDANGFIELHTSDVLRVGPTNLRVGEEYFSSIRKSYSRKDVRKREIAFAMEHRVYSGDTGYEVGYYRLRYFIGDSISGTHYGRFHVRLRREDGRWKIAQDWDVDHMADVPVGEEHFRKADELDL